MEIATLQVIEFDSKDYRDWIDKQCQLISKQCTLCSVNLETGLNSVIEMYIMQALFYADML